MPNGFVAFSGAFGPGRSVGSPPSGVRGSLNPKAGSCFNAVLVPEALFQGPRLAIIECERESDGYYAVSSGELEARPEFRLSHPMRRHESERDRTTALASSRVTFRLAERPGKPV